MGEFLDKAKEKSKKDNDRELLERILANQYITQEMLTKLRDIILDDSEDSSDGGYEEEDFEDLKEQRRRDKEEAQEELESFKRKLKREREEDEKERRRREFRDKHGGSDIVAM
jgi:hypothetical protein